MIELALVVALLGVVCLAIYVVATADDRAARRYAEHLEVERASRLAEVSALHRIIANTQSDAAVERRAMIDAFLAMQSGPRAADAAARMRVAASAPGSIRDLIPGLAERRIGIADDDENLDAMIPVGMGG